MKKQTFIDAINALQKQIKSDIKVSEHLGKAFPNAYHTTLMPDNHFLTNILIRILQEEMNDTELCEYGQSWIEWYCFETDFGQKRDLKAYNADGSEIQISNAEELFDFLNKK